MLIQGGAVGFNSRKLPPGKQSDWLGSSLLLCFSPFPVFNTAAPICLYIPANYPIISFVNYHLNKVLKPITMCNVYRINCINASKALYVSKVEVLMAAWNSLILATLMAQTNFHFASPLQQNEKFRNGPLSTNAISRGTTNNRNSLWLNPISFTSAQLCSVCAHRE